MLRGTHTNAAPTIIDTINKTVVDRIDEENSAELTQLLR
jgi:hypothetical protein